MAITLLGIPHDCNSSFLAGAAKAPEEVRVALVSDSANMFCESGHDLADPELFRSVGDVPLAHLEGQVAYDAIHKAVGEHLTGGGQVIGIGGDHSVTYPMAMAHAEHLGRLSILHFDAHPDLYDNFAGNRFSHASPFARLMESGRIDRLVQIGIRTLNDHQREQAARYGVEQHEMRDLSGIGQIAFSGPVYVSVDLDALDPAYAPGVSHHEPGGMSVRRIIDCIHQIGGKVIGGDIVEYNPVRDINGMTARVAAKLVKELAGRMIDDARS